MTGSEISFFKYALGLGERGHWVEIRTGLVEGSTEHRISKGVQLIQEGYEGPCPIGCCEEMDAVCMWMSPEFVQTNNTGSAFRLYNEQCTDFGNTVWDWTTNVDLFCTLSQWHARHMSTQTYYPRNLFRVMNNGVDLEEFKQSEKVHGRVVWASSHDRGLHHLLSVWPRIRKEVPWATLDVLYSLEGARSFAGRREDPAQPGWVNELGRRSTYSLHALETLKDHGIEVKGSVSRQEIAKAFGEAEVLAYPCDPVRPTETFGNTVLEAMASGCVPVLCLSDAFTELWGPVSPSVIPPLTESNLDAYTRVLVSVLKNDKRRERDAVQCREYAARFSWDLLVAKLERCLETRGQEGLDSVAW